ncbi:glycoside hydrolase domain-containing protein [Streptomyces sp. NPDC001978]|uniref:glycoside hydrolase domain-containing protein n=1 Tax=Streptomyces sp. NPDC001978 TaxID=3364627 RepID=UPI0036B5799E
MRWTRRPRLCLAGVLAAATLLAAPAAPSAEPTDGHLTDLVNPFIGTQNEGNTFPGAAVPFGMVQFSPDTGHKTGYDYAHSRIRGFSLVHLSGVGCRIGGDLPVLPTTGKITQTDNARYAAAFRHEDEQASPGYYRVGLSSGIDAELTATARTGVQRYTFPATDRANVLLNAAQSLHKAVSGKAEILDDRTVRTEITGRGFCRDTLSYTVYTVTHFDRPFTAYGTWGLSTPVFDRVDLTLDPAHWPSGGLTVTAPGTSAADRYVQSARADGVPYDRTYLTTGALRSLRSLDFTVGPRPSEWGTSPQAAPPVLK